MDESFDVAHKAGMGGAKLHPFDEASNYDYSGISFNDKFHQYMAKNT